ncbi:MAG: MoaD/ThiS family protein [Planctomycetota bacterium]
MEVEVRLFAGLREGRFKRRRIELPEATTLREALSRLDIPAEEVSLPLVNGIYSEMDRELVPDDTLALFPAVGGG